MKKVVGAFRSTIDHLDGTPIGTRGIEGTLVLEGLVAALDIIPLQERLTSMFWDIGCGRGYVLLAAMVYGFEKVAGLEQNNFGEHWDLRLAKAVEVRISNHPDSWTQRDPQILWDAQVRDLSGLKRYFGKYRWHGNVAIYLFWTGWASVHKQTVLEFIRTCSQVRHVCIADECRRPQGHRQTFEVLVKAGFTMNKCRSKISIARSVGSENFTLVYWRRDK